MAQTDNLLRLVEEFPAAFIDPEGSRPSTDTKATTSHPQAPHLLALIGEFPQAFADPEATQLQPEPEVTSPEPNPEPHLAQTPLPTVPVGYEQALRRRVQTLNWGTIDFTLTYGESGLAAIWVTAGKSGTEVQSLCEAIARLVNLLLARQVAVAEIVREIRGIRGADSEGLGPHRILGLADLIGKILQEAPASLGGAAAAIAPPLPSTPEPTPAPMASEAIPVSNGAPAAELLLELTVDSASLCPECGSELQQANGCKGGACLVCGYSSCS